MKVIPIVSGGLDSVTMLYDLIDSGNSVETVVSFNYGQRHKKELEFATKHADVFQAEHIIINLYTAGLTDVFASSTSALTNPDVDVPEGHYAEENMKATVVPNRNMIMLAIAGGVAISKNANAIATAVHAGDHFIYPDCRPGFINALNTAMIQGNAGFGALPEDSCSGSEFILTPYIHLTKTDIVERAIEHFVPLEQTWSCYQGGKIHCGRCGTCVERLEAVDAAYVRMGLDNQDETEYNDTEYWKQALAKGI